jgi:hypothetical protein
MSLGKLLEVRKAGMKPAFVHVWIGGQPRHGTKSKWVADEPDEIVIDRAGMDLRALTGIPIYTCDIGQTTAKHEAIHAEIMNLNPFAMVLSHETMDAHEAYVLTSVEGENKKIVENLMRKMWRLGNHG